MDCRTNEVAPPLPAGAERTALREHGTGPGWFHHAVHLANDFSAQTRTLKARAVYLYLGRRQWTSRGLPRGYLRSPRPSRSGSRDLASWDKLPNGRAFLHTDDITLTSDSLTELELEPAASGRPRRAGVGRQGDEAKGLHTLSRSGSDEGHA